VKTEAVIREDQWLDPGRGQVSFGEYAEAWIEERPDLRMQTIQVYRYILRRHLNPTFGNRPLADIREAHVRRWRKELLDRGASSHVGGKGISPAKGDHEHGCG
jgi:Phage integrase, N-terminal SAM-like domain